MPDQKLKNRTYNFFENWFIPMTFGVAAVVVAVQFIGMLPDVRNAMDRVEGRFQKAMAVNAEPPGLVGTTAVITLHISLGSRGSGIEVMKNQQSLGAFTTDQMRVSVHEGDVIHFVDVSGVATDIRVDTGSSQLLEPASGQVITLSPSHRRAGLTPAKFL